jgi:hypothetical protein
MIYRPPFLHVWRVDCSIIWLNKLPFRRFRMTSKAYAWHTRDSPIIDLFDLSLLRSTYPVHYTLSSSCPGKSLSGTSILRSFMWEWNGQKQSYLYLWWAIVIFWCILLPFADPIFHILYRELYFVMSTPAFRPILMITWRRHISWLSRRD